ncbi:hypothetical protein TNCV_1999821 [Trichonephila clavipes]|nr:hypothetical protein TNCV_1999821 [Trichonephila clavipes]
MGGQKSDPFSYASPRVKKQTPVQWAFVFFRICDNSAECDGKICTSTDMMPLGSRRHRLDFHHSVGYEGLPSAGMEVQPKEVQ